MRGLLLFTLVLAVGCQKSAPTPVAQVNSTEAAAGNESLPTRKKAPRRSKRVPLAERTDRTMIPQLPPPTPKSPPKPTLARDEAVAAVQLYLTTQGSTTAAVGNSSEAQENRPQNFGGGYSDVQVTAIGEAKEVAHVAETKKIGWVVPVSFSASNPRQKYRLRATNHLFLVSRPGENGPVKVYFHGSSEELAKAKLGEEWYILNRPPRPSTETMP